MKEKDKQEDRIWRRKTRGQNMEEKHNEKDRIWRRKTSKRTEYGGERQARGQNMEEKDSHEDIKRRTTII